MSVLIIHGHVSCLALIDQCTVLTLTQMFQSFLCSHTIIAVVLCMILNKLYEDIMSELFFVFCLSTADSVNAWTSRRWNLFDIGKMEVAKFAFDTQGGKKMQETQKFQSDCTE